MEVKLERKLGLWAVVSLGIGSTIGTGIFSTMSEVASISGCALILIIAFTIGGLLQIPANFCYAELSSAYPENGGYYIYIREAGSPSLAFFCGWSSFWALDPPSISIMALGLVNHLAFLTHLDSIVLRTFSVLIIVVIMITHIMSVSVGSVVQVILTVLKVIPFVIVLGLGLFYVKENFIASEVTEMTNYVNSSPGWILTIFSAIAATTFAYDGMYAPTYMTGEVKNPRKVMPVAFVIMAVVVILLYVGLSVVSSGLLSTEQIMNSDAPIAEVASQIPLIGGFAEYAVAIMAAIVIVGTMTSAIMYQPRLAYSMAKDGHFFKIFEKVHPKYKSPHVAIIIHCCYSIILTFVGDLSMLLGYFTLMTLIRNFSTFGAIFFLRNKKSYKPSYKAPGGLACPIISCLITGALIIGILFAQPIPSLLGIGILFSTGFVAYWIWKKKRNAK